MQLTCYKAAGKNCITNQNASAALLPRCIAVKHGMGLQVEWEEYWWEASDWAGMKELGAEKSGCSADGAAWRETWREAIAFDPFTGEPTVERTAHKWAHDAKVSHQPYLPGLRLHDCVYLPGLWPHDFVYLTGRFQLVFSRSMYRVMVIQKDLQMMLHFPDGC